MTIAEFLTRAAERLRQNEIPEFRREASSLLSFVLNKNKAFLIAHPEYRLTTEEAASFESVVRRRAGREPYQYIVGRQEFYGLDFEVTQGVLIPRPETEILVEAAIGLLAGIKNPIFYEIGVGSGCISVSILAKVKDSRAVGVDISDNALALSKKNAQTHNVAARLKLRKANVFEGMSGTVDLIVSNPPYIPQNELADLQPEVGQFEPHSALFGGPDGLDIIRSIAHAAPLFLKPGGFILIEIGFGQAGGVEELFDPDIWKDVDFLPDFQGIPRIAKARFSPSRPRIG